MDEEDEQDEEISFNTSLMEKNFRSKCTKKANIHPEDMISSIIDQIILYYDKSEDQNLFISKCTELGSILESFFQNECNHYFKSLDKLLLFFENLLSRRIPPNNALYPILHIILILAKLQDNNAFICCNSDDHHLLQSLLEIINITGDGKVFSTILQIIGFFTFDSVRLGFGIPMIELTHIKKIIRNWPIEVSSSIFIYAFQIGHIFSFETQYFSNLLFIAFTIIVINKDIMPTFYASFNFLLQKDPFNLFIILKQTDFFNKIIEWCFPFNLLFQKNPKIEPNILFENGLYISYYMMNIFTKIISIDLSKAPPDYDPLLLEYLKFLPSQFPIDSIVSLFTKENLIILSPDIDEWNSSYRQILGFFYELSHDLQIPSRNLEIIFLLLSKIMGNNPEKSYIISIICPVISKFIHESISLAATFRLKKAALEFLYHVTLIANNEDFCLFFEKDIIETAAENIDSEIPLCFTAISLLYSIYPRVPYQDFIVNTIASYKDSMIELLEKSPSDIQAQIQSLISLIPEMV